MRTTSPFSVYCAFIFKMAFLSACSSSEELPKHDYTSILVPVNTEEVFNFEQYVESVTINPLETTDESLIRSIYNILYQNDKVFIFDKFAQRLHVFHQDGSFLFNLDKRGRGPEEYLEMRDVAVDEKGHIHVLSYRKVHIYDSLRRLVKTIPISHPGKYAINPTGLALAFDEGYYLYVGAFGLRRREADRFAVYKVNADGVVQGDAWFPVINNGAEFPRFYKIADEPGYIFTPMLGNDTLYRFEATGVNPTYYLDYGDRKLPREYYEGFGLGRERFEAASRENFVMMTEGVIETSAMLSYRFWARGNNLWCAFYSKRSSESICFPYFKEAGAKDYFPRLRGGAGNQFYGHIDAQHLIEGKVSGKFKRHFGYLEKFEELEAVIGSLNANSNPVLMTVTLKDF